MSQQCLVTGRLLVNTEALPNCTVQVTEIGELTNTVDPKHTFTRPYSHVVGRCVSGPNGSFSLTFLWPLELPNISILINTLQVTVFNQYSNPILNASKSSGNGDPECPFGDVVLVDVLKGIMDRFANYDRNDDGAPSITSLSYLGFERPENLIPPTSKLVLVLVESRLLVPLQGAHDLIASMSRFKDDLAAEGLPTRFVSVSLYEGSRHQDGRTLLAMRRFFQAVRLSYTKFTGVVLVGSFPEATLVRRPLVVRGDPARLCVWPEMIAGRADIVLADLNGPWQSLYQESPVTLDGFAALPDSATAAAPWPEDGGVFSSDAVETTTLTCQDFFYILDDDYAPLPAAPQHLRVIVRRQRRNPEVSAADLVLPNPIARPNINISRINARNVAVNPKAGILGDDGTPPLDSHGNPQSFTTTKTVPSGMDMFEEDRILERKLLWDYFERNNQYRHGVYAARPYRSAAIATPDFSAGSTADWLNEASPNFLPALAQEDASLVDLVNWFRQSAVLRGIEAHANEFSTEFPKAYNEQDLEAAAGGRPFRWHRTGNTYQPSFSDQGNSADLYLYRTVYCHGILNGTSPSFIVHGGCLVNEEANISVPFYDPNYAKFQNAESILFYMNGLAIISRAKEFYDRPEPLPAAFGRSPSSCLGDGWRAYFEQEASDSTLSTFDYGLKCKKAYFWSVLGDWTLRLRYAG